MSVEPNSDFLTDVQKFFRVPSCAPLAPTLVPLVATLGLKMGILGENPQDLESALREPFNHVSDISDRLLTRQSLYDRRSRNGRNRSHQAISIDVVNRQAYEHLHSPGSNQPLRSTFAEN
jgi:hypothetical protein